MHGRLGVDLPACVYCLKHLALLWCIKQAVLESLGLGDLTEALAGGGSGQWTAPLEMGREEARDKAAKRAEQLAVKVPFKTAQGGSAILDRSCYVPVFAPSPCAHSVHLYDTKQTSIVQGCRLNVRTLA